MSITRVRLQLFLLMLLTSETGADQSGDYKDDEEIEDVDPEKIDLKISNTSRDIIVNWTTPDPSADPLCYSSQLQLKDQCAADWKQFDNNHDTFWSSESTLSLRRNYDFRVRMKLECFQWSWSEWGKVQSWRKNTESCMTDESSSLWTCFSIFLTTITLFFLFCLLKKDSIERFLFPDVPDPEQFKSKIMDTDQSEQWWSDLRQWDEDISMVDVEIISQSETEPELQSVVVHPIIITPEQHNDPSYL